MEANGERRIICPSVHIKELYTSVYPTQKVFRQFRNGSADSVKTLYKFIGSVPEVTASVPEE